MIDFIAFIAFAAFSIMISYFLFLDSLATLEECGEKNQPQDLQILLIQRLSRIKVLESRVRVAVKALLDISQYEFDQHLTEGELRHRLTIEVPYKAHVALDKIGARHIPEDDGKE